jgi:hypothetical protein
MRSLLRVAPVLFVALAATWQAASLLQQNLAFTKAQTEVGFWGRGEYQPESSTIENTGRRINTLVQRSPGHPEYLGLQANYATWRGYWAQDMEERMAFSLQAMASQKSALQTRPAHRHSWSKMVEYAARTSTGEAAQIAAQAHLQALLPNPLLLNQD